MGTEHLGQGEHEIGRGRPRGQGADRAHADDHRLRQRDRLSEHGRLGFDPADPPPEDAQAVDHRRVRVGPHHRVGEGDPVAHRDDLPEVLQVDLMADPRARRDHPDVVERPLCPAQEAVALGVAPVLELDVGLVGVRGPEQVDLHGVIDHEIDGDERVDDTRVPPGTRHGASHGREVDHRGNTGEVLHQDARGHERDVASGPRPRGERNDVLVGDVARPRTSQQVLEQDAHRVGQTGRDRDPLLGELVEPRERHIAVGCRKAPPGAVERRRHRCPSASAFPPSSHGLAAMRQDGGDPAPRPSFRPDGLLVRHPRRTPELRRTLPPLLDLGRRP